MNLTLSKHEFSQLSAFIYKELGIKLPEKKLSMLSGRLSKRLRALNLPSFAAYRDFLFSPQGLEEEMVHLINAVTTNKTEFFREPKHFHYLTGTALPELQRLNTYGRHNSLRVWSAGCSTGEEAYTLAMVLNEFGTTQPGFQFDILATDISTRVLQVARRAVYPMERIEPIAPPLRKKYLLRSRNRKNPEVRIAPALREKVRFGRLNFMDEDFGLPQKVDIIFCRNVIIYFDKPTQEQLMRKFSRYVNHGGYLFLGHSESLHDYDTPFVQVAPTIYRSA